MSEPLREQREITSLGEWLTWRREHITASRIAALFDLHPFLSRDGLAAELRGESGEVPNSSMRDGHILEAGFPYAVKADGKGWDLVKATSYHWLPEHQLGATPDFFISDDGLLQAKTCSVQQWEKWHGAAPIAYLLQTLTELLVTGRSWGVLAIMIRTSGHPVHYFDVPRHALAERRILDAVAAWWREYDSGTLPGPAPAAEITAELDDGSHRDLSSDNELPAILAERAMLTDERRIRDKRLDEIDETLKARIGAARTAWLPGWNLTFRSQTRRETVIPEKTFRVLRISATKEDDAA